jgi:DNA polymerase-3 subunit delta
MAAAVASGQTVQAVVTRYRVWPPARKPILAAALQRLPLSRCQILLQHCARIDRVSKGQAAGNTWDELLQLTLALAGNQALPDVAAMEQVS